MYETSCTKTGGGQNLAHELYAELSFIKLFLKTLTQMLVIALWSSFPI